MADLARALGRLLIMGAVLAAVIVTCLVVGVGTTIAVALGIVLAGLVGLVGVARRPAAAAAQTDGERSAARFDQPVEHGSDSAVEAMDPAAATPVDPEALMPRWRRPSLLEARHTDPTRRPATAHSPLRFGHRRAEADLRIVRYAVVPVMDRPDEVLGARLTVLGAGDEVEVVEVSGTFLEVIRPGGERGWIHRMTVSQPSPAYLAPPPRSAAEPEAEDALTALLAARGLQ